MAARGVIANSLWTVAPGEMVHRTHELADPGPGEARLRMLYSGVSRGTERLVLQGHVPKAEWARMRAPLQEGDFPYPVKYGYCAVGVVEAGPAALLGQTMFCLHPHQDVFTAPIAMLAPVPPTVPPLRATLAANMETALNAIWDSGAGPCDRITVIGAGVLGLLVATLAGRIPGAVVTLIDIDPDRAALAHHLGVGFALPAAAPVDQDLVFHTSASEAGLATAIACAGLEASIIEMSWYGDRAPAIPLGGAFHSRRLRLISSQVGHVSPTRRPRWDYARRLEASLGLLADPRLDALLPTPIAFADAAAELPALLMQGTGLAPVIAYPSAP